MNHRSYYSLIILTFSARKKNRYVDIHGKILRINLSFSGEALITLIPHVREWPFSPVKSLLKGAHHFAKPHTRLPAARNKGAQDLARPVTSTRKITSCWEPWLLNNESFRWRVHFQGTNGIPMITSLQQLGSLIHHNLWIG